MVNSKREVVNASRRQANSGQLSKDSGSIQVVVRLRPMNEREKKFGTLPVVNASTSERTVTVVKDRSARKARLTYSFDNVYTAFSTQEEVFEQTMLPVFDDVLNGYESTVFAYGQTGTGKTYTVEGDMSNLDSHGIIPRSATTIFERLNSGSYQDYKVTCSYLEIYNEELSDLLAEYEGSGNRTKLEIMVSKTGPFCRGLSEKEVSTPEDVLKLMTFAQNRRQVGETKMNKSSSRSHCIFTIKIKAKSVTDDGTGLLQINGKLHMVDLAGSECAKSATGDPHSEINRERERMNINRSLLTLGRVISMLKEQNQSGNKKSIRIPYRDSKLTRILQESLGGRCKTVVIATLSPSVTVIDESISTLNYAQSANRIVNKPVTNSYMSSKMLALGSPKSTLTGDDELDMYKSVEDWNEMEIRLQYMEAQVEEAQSALARKHMLQQEAEEKAEKATAEKEEMDQVVAVQRQEIESLHDSLEAEIQKRKESEDELAVTKTKLTEQTFRAEKAEEMCERLEEDLNNANHQIDSLEEELERQIGLKKDAFGKLRDTSIEFKKTRAVLSTTRVTESLLTAEAQELLGTLKDSISDGDSLYDLLEKHRETDIQMRANTLQYSNVQNKILEDILQFLFLFSQRAATLCEKLSTDEENNYALANNAIDQTSSLFQQISTEISEIANTMRKQIVAEGGIVPNVASTTSDALAGLDSASKIITESEDALFNAMTFLRARLKDHSAEVGRLWTVLDANAEASVTALESNVQCSKEKVSQIISSTNETLEAVKNVQKETRQSLSELVSTWESLSVESTQNVNSTATARRNVVNESLKRFKTEMRKIDDIDNVLSTQDVFITTSQEDVKSKLDKQKMTLEDLKKEQVNECKKMDLLRKSFISNVMEGVQSLIDEQMSRIEVENVCHFNSCEERNKTLMQQNSVLATSTSSIFDNVKNSNAVLSEKSKNLRKNDQDAVNTMETSAKTLDDISNSSRNHGIATKMHARNVEENISKLSKLDTDNDGLVDILNSNKIDITRHLENAILQKGKENLHLLAGSGRDLASYGDTVLVPECYASLDGLEAPRPTVIQNFISTIHKNKERLEDGKSRVESICEKQCDKSDELRTYARSKEDYYANEIYKSQKTQLENQKETLIFQTQEYRKSTSKDISICSASTSTVKNNVEDFVVETINAREDVRPLIERTTFNFNEKFSATPEDNVICQNLNFEQEMAIGVKT